MASIYTPTRLAFSCGSLTGGRQRQMERANTGYRQDNTGDRKPMPVNSPI
jgi:hypothetical protein